MPYPYPDLDKFIDNHEFASEYLDEVRTHWSRVSRILIVVDGNIGITEDSSLFSISRVVRAVHGFKAGLASIKVTVATREGVADHNPHAAPLEFTYKGFRFDQGGATHPVLKDFDQVWLFGHRPTDADLPPGEEATDASPADPLFHPLSGSEVSALARWMNQGGGVFATGDHGLLGASMCRDVPRVNTMRRWKLSEGVPTHYDETRYCTHRPATVEEMQGIDEITFEEAEDDAVPQPLDIVPFGFIQTGHGTKKIPHPILAHPTLGTIDVLPDHMHEGACYDPGDPAWQSSGHLGQASFVLDGVMHKHFPPVPNDVSRPQVIAWGETPASPPLWYDSGPQPYRKVPMIVVYDGERANVGRVVVDSTWHHWFDMNLVGLEAAPGQLAYQKILGYYRNVAIWLASPYWRASMTMGGLKAGQFDYFGIEGATLDADPSDLGQQVSTYLAQSVGQWGYELAGEALRRLGRRLDFAQPGDKRSGFKPTEVQVRYAVLGELTRLLYADRRETSKQLSETGKISKPRDLPAEPFDVAIEAAKRAVAGVPDRWRKDIEASREQLDQFIAAATGEAPTDEKAEPVEVIITPEAV